MARRTSIIVTKLSVNLTKDETTRVLLPVSRIDEVAATQWSKWERSADGVVSGRAVSCDASRITKVNGEILYVAESPEQIQTLIEEQPADA